MHHTHFLQRPGWLLPGALFLVVALVGLAACAPGGVGATGSAANGTTPASTPGATATQGTGNSSANQGTLNGVVLAGPSCPVQTAERPCPPTPVPDRQITIATTAGKVVVTATTDKQGHFSAHLPPGIYVIRVAPNSRTLPIQRVPTVVTIVAGKTLSIQILLDSGIR